MLAHPQSLLPNAQQPQVGCLVKDFKAADYMDGKDAKRQGRYTQFAMAATKIALEDAQLDSEAVDKVPQAPMC